MSRYFPSMAAALAALLFLATASAANTGALDVHRAIIFEAHHCTSFRSSLLRD